MLSSKAKQLVMANIAIASGRLTSVAQREKGKILASISVLSILPSRTQTKCILSIMKVCYKNLRGSDRVAKAQKSLEKYIFYLRQRL
jgi:hypothetical protein